MKTMYIHGDLAVGGYFTPTHVTNWDGSQRYRIQSYSRSVTNWQHERIDVWFTVNGKEWWGRHQGNNNTVVHCKELKS